MSAQDGGVGAQLRRRVDGILAADGLIGGGTGAAIIALLMLFLVASTFSIALTQIAYFGALLVWAGSMVRRQRNEIPATPLDRYLLAFVIAEALSTAVALNTPQALLYMQRRIVLLPILYVLAANAASPRRLRMLLGTFLLSASLMALWNLRDLLLHFGEYLRFERRLAGYHMVMTAGGVMMIALLMLIPFLLHPGTPKRVRLWGLLATAPLLLNLFFSFTRSSWLGFIAGVLFIGAMGSRRVLLPLLGAAVLAGVFATPEIRDRITSIVDPTHPNNVTRVNMWKTGLRIFLDHPVLGIGDIGTEILWSRYSAPGWNPEGHLHNNLLMWLVTLGVVGFGVLSALFVKIWLVVRGVYRRARDDWFAGSLALGTLAVLVGFHVNGLFEWNFGDAEIIMLVWAMVGLTLAAGRMRGSGGNT